MASITITGVTEEEVERIDKLAETGQTDRSKTIRGIMSLASQFPTLDSLRFHLREYLKEIE